MGGGVAAAAPAFIERPGLPPMRGRPGRSGMGGGGAAAAPAFTERPGLPPMRGRPGRSRIGAGSVAGMGEHLDLRGRTVLVTGAARGIGREVAVRVAAKGARVALVGLHGEPLERQAAALGAARAAWFEADVADRAAVEAAVDGTLERFGSIDVVVANAGIAPPPATMLAVSDRDFRRVLDVNVGGAWNTVKATLPHVVAARGYVMVVSSLYAMVNGVLAAPYAMSKAAGEQLGRALRAELRPHGASAGTAYLGFVDTDLVRESFEKPVFQELLRSPTGLLAHPIPVGRAGAAIVRGIERRRARVVAPEWARPLLAARGLLQLLDDPLTSTAATRAGIALAEHEPDQVSANGVAASPASPRT